MNIPLYTDDEIKKVALFINRLKSVDMPNYSIVDKAWELCDTIVSPNQSLTNFERINATAELLSVSFSKARKLEKENNAETTHE